MWSRQQADVQLEEVLFAICHSIRNTAERKRFRDEIPHVLHRTRTFQEAAEAGRCWTLQPDDASDGAPSAVADSYHARFSARGSAGRPFYDTILVHGKSDVCPYCNIGLVQELDHYLPKHLFKQLALSPDNLVPCCTDCNRNKDKYFGDTAHTEWFNPFRSPVGIKWLHCDYSADPEPRLTYSVRQGPAEYVDVLRRVQNQFDKLRLGQMYDSKATRRLTIVSRRVARCCKGWSASDVAEYLLDEAQDVGGVRNRTGLDENNWEYAMYEALAASEQYCAGGYLQVVNGEKVGPHQGHHRVYSPSAAEVSDPWQT